MINQYGRIKVDLATELQELEALGFNSENFETLLRQALPSFHSMSSQNDWLRLHLATTEQDIYSFFQQKLALDQAIFYRIGAQLLGFNDELANNNLDGVATFQQLGLPIVAVDNIPHAWYTLLNTHNSSGLLLIDALVSQGYLPQNNQRLIFNGKSLPTFDTNDLIRESVWVETSVDTDNDGQLDLVQVDIVRPKSETPLPVLFTASPYYQGLNVKENDAKIHSVNVPLQRKEPTQIDKNDVTYQGLSASTAKPREVAGHATETEVSFTAEAGLPVDLNQYFLSRGFAIAYSAGVGTRHADGMQDTGSPEQVESMKNVVEWLAGNRVAFTNRYDNIAITADWSSHKIAMTGRSYLGTLATAVATTGVEGLETVVSEAAISNWYQYYRDNGLVVAPGGFPGEDMDVLAELVYTRMKDPADWWRTRSQWQAFQSETAHLMARDNGNYDRYWDSRNYLNHVQNIKIDMLMVHGLNDWNVKPRQVYQLWSALKQNNHVKKIYLHQGEHININNNRSLDFSDQINLWFSEKLLGLHVDATTALPTVTWQDNTNPEAWHALEDWGIGEKVSYHFADKKLSRSSQSAGEASFRDWLPEEQFNHYGKHFNAWRQAIISGKIPETAQIFKTEALSTAQTIDGEITLNLRVKSSKNVGLLSAMIVDYGTDQYLKVSPTPQEGTVDRGRNFSPTRLMAFEMTKANQKMVTLGHINLQNRTNAWQTDDLQADEFVNVSLTLQPTHYQMRSGHQLGVVLYATDFEMTVRGNQDIVYTIDLANSQIDLPIVNK